MGYYGVGNFGYDHRFRLEILLTLTFQDKPMLFTEKKFKASCLHTHNI